MAYFKGKGEICETDKCQLLLSLAEETALWACERNLWLFSSRQNEEKKHQQNRLQMK